MAAVTVYSTATCPSCVKAKRFLEGKGIAFVEKRVDESAEAMDEVKALGARSLPVVVVNVIAFPSVVIGFSAVALEKALTTQGLLPK